GRLDAAEEADVFVVEVDVHEPVQLTVLVQQRVAQTGVRTVEILDQLTQGAALAVHLLRPARVLSQDGGDADFDGHVGASPPVVRVPARRCGRRSEVQDRRQRLQRGPAGASSPSTYTLRSVTVPSTML